MLRLTGRLGGGDLAQTLAVKRREIDRIDVKRRKAAGADGLCDDLAREGKQAGADTRS